MDNNTKVKYAGFWIRSLSTFVDGVIISFIFVVLFTLYWLIVYPLTSGRQFLEIYLYLFPPALYAIVFAFYVLFSGRRISPGKKLFGLVTVDSHLDPISRRRAALRTLFFLLDSSVFGLGHLFILFNRSKQTLHDRIAKTFVIHKPSPAKPARIGIVLFCGAAIYLLALSYIHNFVQAFRIPTTSMEPTIEMGDHFLVDKYWPNQHEPHQGDLVVFKYPENEKILYVKRCIATEGQVVEMRNDTCFIDGAVEGNYELEQLFMDLRGDSVRDIRVSREKGPDYMLRFLVSPWFPREHVGPVRVPEDHCFVLGDFRDNSADSRVWGFVPYENIVGQAGVIYFSYDPLEWRSNRKLIIRWNRFGKAII